MSDRIRVAVVDDHPLLREGVVRSLEASGRFDVVAEGGSADEAVAVASRHLPDILLLDLSMPGGGLAAAGRIVAEAPSVRIVVLTASESDEDVMAALRIGAKGYVLKGVGSASLVAILQGVAAGESYVAPTLAARLLTEMRDRPGRQGEPPDPFRDLTPREDEILRHVAQGRSNKEVALALDLQEKTVKHHMTRILDKLQVRNRTEAALLVRERDRG